MKPGTLGGLLLLATTACRNPTPVDPAAEAFHTAVVRFAEVSRVTQDLTYRDPRFDPILAALDRIPAGSEPKAEALALAERIRGARTAADLQERDSDRLRAQAEAAPPFEAQPQLPRGAARRVMPQAQPSAEASAEASALAPSAHSYADQGSSAPVEKAPARRLPSWYDGYFGTGEASADAGDGASAPVQEEATPAPPPPPPHKATPKPEDPLQPPPVFGLPGPAGGALRGNPGGE